MARGENHTELLFVVDRSGSMASMVEPTISGYNEVLRENKGAEGTASVTLCLFDDEILFPYDHVDVAEVEPLDTSTYVPRGMTALLDAIGKTVDDERARQKAMPKEERPGKTIVVIITDGLENASREWDYASIRKLLDKVQGKKHRPWAVTFLGANIDVSREAARLGIMPERAKSYMADRRGYQTAYAGVAQMSAALRDSDIDFEDDAAMDAVYGSAFADLDADYATRSGKANNPADEDDMANNPADEDDRAKIEPLYGPPISFLMDMLSTRSGKANKPADEDNMANIEPLYGPPDPLFDDLLYDNPFDEDLEEQPLVGGFDIDEPVQSEYDTPLGSVLRTDREQHEASILYGPPRIPRPDDDTIPDDDPIPDVYGVPPVSPPKRMRVPDTPVEQLRQRIASLRQRLRRNDGPDGRN